jgi:hypothetical protein
MSASMVKTMLGITDSTYDSQISIQLPVVSMDIRKYLNKTFQKHIFSDFDAGDTEVTLGDARLEIGTVLQGDGIPDDTYIASYDYESGKYTLSTAVTDSADVVYPTISINQWSPVARMVLYKISKMTVSSATEKDVVSRSIDATSWTFSNGDINRKYGYPQKLLDELGLPNARIS